MTGEQPALTATLRIGAGGLPITGWTLEVLHGTRLRDGQLVAIARSTDGHLSIVAGLADLDRWVTDLLSLITMAEIRAHTVTGQHNEREAHSGETPAGDD